MFESSICCHLPPQFEEEEKWNLLHAETLKRHLIPTNNSRWGRMLCTWHEKKEDGKVLDHHYAACIDLENCTWFIDDTPLKIYVKCVFQLLLRPFHTILKMLSHISLAQIANNIFKTMRGQQSIDTCIQNSVRSICDIVRTPLFGLAMIISSIAVLVLGAINPESMYTNRDILGKIEQMSNWGERNTRETLTPCFQAIPLSFIQKFEDQKFKDTVFFNDDPIERKLALIMRAHLKYLQKKNKLGLFIEEGTFKIKTPYVSPILLQKTKAL